MPIFSNRTLDLKRIKAIGFDMDYTIVRYHSEQSEQMTYKEVLKKLVLQKGYPKAIENLKFDYKRAIKGLVIDRKNGNLLKLSLYGKIKMAFHGTKPLEYKAQLKTYQGMYVDLNDPNYEVVDTSFSIAYGVLFAQLVDIKDSKKTIKLPAYEVMESDILEMVDLSHRDGSLKRKIAENIEKYIIQDPECVQVLERLRSDGKILMLITNSDFYYTKLLMEHTINPFLKKYKHWTELFNFTITSSSKPRFFTDKLSFLKVDPKTGLMSNFDGKLTEGVYQGGSAKNLQTALGLTGEDILYLGDHIYGDIVTLKKACNWRTALVIEELDKEIECIKKSQKTQEILDFMMEEKSKLEDALDEINLKTKIEKKDKEQIGQLITKIETLNARVSAHIQKFKKYFNPHWGEIMRAGNEESRYAGQVEKYACIYMAKISDFSQYSSKRYFRPVKRLLPHEV
ncbi:MAG: HAD-IG family 5'-nucleotidase [Xanthomonadaceae bacterium]|nr:HAD-IG family 5'-nucleotidase [Xanthomonadaceae bacterium]